MVWFGYTLHKYTKYFLYVLQHVSTSLVIFRFTITYYKKTLTTIIIETCNGIKNLLFVSNGIHEDGQ
jgi:hypothetical protein